MSNYERFYYRASTFFSLISMNSFAMQDLGTTNISEPTYRGHPEISRAPEFKNNLDKPYYIVIFDINLTGDRKAYDALGEKMVSLAKTMPGFIDATAITSGDREVVLCSWSSSEAIQNWYDNVEHIKAQKLGETTYFEKLRLRIAKVERDYTHAITPNK